MTYQLETIANFILENSDKKPNYSNRTFMNCVLIFQSAIMDKLYDNQDYDKMNIEDRLKMAEACGKELHRFIHTFTGLDTHKIEEFL